MFDDGAHTDATWRDYKESIEAVRVSPKQASESRYLLLSGRGQSEAEVDDSRVRKDLPEDELAKIAVVGDQNALLMSRDGQDFGIWKPRSVVSYDGFSS